MKYFVQAVVLGLVSCGASQAWCADNVEAREGHRLALKICSACHVIGPDQQTAPLLRHPAPSFAQIAKQRDVSPGAIRQFLRSTHTDMVSPFEMPNPQLLDQQADAIAAYLLSLKDSRRDLSDHGLPSTAAGK